jgi:thioredoxin-like negative regulator of GroEL
VELARLLYERGDVEGLRARADADDPHAALTLAGLLHERGDVDRAEQLLRACIDAGYRHADEELVLLLADRGRSDDAERLRRFGLMPDGSIAGA